MAGKTRTIAGKGGQRPIHFKEGGLHASTGTPAGKPISAAKHAAAASGRLGPKAAKQEAFFRNVRMTEAEAQRLVNHFQSHMNEYLALAPKVPWVVDEENAVPPAGYTWP